MPPVTELVAPPDAAQIIIDFLRDATDIPGSSAIPKTRPARFYRVVQVPSAGFEGRALFRAVLSVESWGTSAPDAADMANVAIAHLEAATAFYAECGGPGWLPDPLTGTPRYQFTAQVALRGHVL